jgi:uncharacterized membrane protein
MPDEPEIRLSAENGSAQPAKRNWTHDLRSRFGVMGELFGFLWNMRLWWLIPMVVVLLVFFLIFILGASSPLAPFIYSLR